MCGRTNPEELQQGCKHVKSGWDQILSLHMQARGIINFYIPEKFKHKTQLSHRCTQQPQPTSHVPLSQSVKLRINTHEKAAFNYSAQQALPGSFETDTRVILKLNSFPGLIAFSWITLQQSVSIPHKVCKINVQTRHLPFWLLYKQSPLHLIMQIV